MARLFAKRNMYVNAWQYLYRDIILDLNYSNDETKHDMAQRCKIVRHSFL